MTKSKIRIENGEFVDEYGRVLNFRGVNVSGSSKIPSSNGTSSFWETKEVSFVNRPFPLEDAEEHCARLQRWGLRLIRFIVTWEAIEHEGPGIYDMEYIYYVRQVLEIAERFGLGIYIDPHQDVWSRWTGGDGAPLWTLECVGLDPRHFHVTKAALCQETYGGTAQDYPKMIWPTNYFKMACCTMFTLFWDGDRCAPNAKYKGQSIQTFLQTHYINAMLEFLRALQGLKNIVGIGTMNEPSPGYIGVQDLSIGYVATELKYGVVPTPFQGMCLAEGIPQQVGVWSVGLKQHLFGRPDHYCRIDPLNLRAWASGRSCVWKDAGVWEVDAGIPQLLKPQYFANINFGEDCYVPFAQKYAQSVQSLIPGLLIFVELPPLEFAVTPFPEIPPSKIPNAVNATHWYDGLTLFMRVWFSYFSFDTRTDRVVLGKGRVRKMHRSQLADIKRLGLEKMHNAPTLIGESGIPFNMHQGKSYRTGDFTSQIQALDNTIRSMEANLLSYTLWCYTPDNNNLQGDLWNNEDLSVFSRDQGAGVSVDAPYYACRAADALVRPYAERISGTPICNEFDLSAGRYTLEFLCAKTTEMPTEIFVPKLHFKSRDELCIQVSDGSYEIEEHDHWFTLRYTHTDTTSQHKVQLDCPRRSRLQKKKRFKCIMVWLLVPVLLGLLWFFVGEFA